MHGYTKHELAERAKIRQSIEEGDYEKARTLSLAFLRSPKRRLKRSVLLRTVAFWVTAMNGAKR